MGTRSRRCRRIPRNSPSSATGSARSPRGRAGSRHHEYGRAAAGRTGRHGRGGRRTVRGHRTVRQAHTAMGDNEMERTRLGDTGLRISRLALGCMSYGDPTTEGAHRWALADDEAQPFFRQAIELGITFWDTANVYQAGTSEEVTGRAF